MPAAKPPEFRRRAVDLVRRGEQSVPQIAKDLGISESCLRRWGSVDDVDTGRRDGISSDEVLGCPLGLVPHVATVVQVSAFVLADDLAVVVLVIVLGLGVSLPSLSDDLGVRPQPLGRVTDEPRCRVRHLDQGRHRLAADAVDGSPEPVHIVVTDHPPIVERGLPQLARRTTGFDWGQLDEDSKLGQAVLL